MKKILHNIPTNIITGFLGAGKTTAIRHLLKTKPTQEKWAVLVNEFGEVGIDGALLETDNIAVKEVPGGCMCCATGLPSKVALNELIRTHRPDRILIEPTGLAHPQQIVRQFSGPEYQTLLDMRAVVCLVDPWCLNDEKFLSLPAFESQLQLADVLVATKVDEALPEHMESFDHYCEQLIPVKALTAKIQHGQLDWHWLNLPHAKPINKIREQKNALIMHPPALDATKTTPSNVVTKLTRKENSAEFGYSCGWLFPADWVFDFEKLKTMIEALEIPRIKGLIDTRDGWKSLNRMRTTVSSEDIVLKNKERIEQGRLEMINLEVVDWSDIEEKLLACRDDCP